MWENPSLRGAAKSPESNKKGKPHSEGGGVTTPPRIRRSEMDYETVVLHTRRELLEETATLLNREWPRSMAAR